VANADVFFPSTRTLPSATGRDYFEYLAKHVFALIAIAYATFDRSKIHVPEINLINLWPGINESKEKVPTAARYRTPPPIAMGFEPLSNWDLGSQQNVKDYFKLFFDLEFLNDTIGNKSESAARNHKDVRIWLQDYLKALYDHISRHICDDLRLTDWNSTTVYYVFSVPARWDGTTAHKIFEKTVRTAGFGRSAHHTLEVNLTEAEASAVYAERTSKCWERATFEAEDSEIAPRARKKSPSMEEGNIILLCDAGGGTTVRALRRFHCSFPNPAMPPRGTTSVHTSLAVTSQSHTVVSSTAANAVPALLRGSSRTTSLSSVNTGLASFIGGGPLLEEEEGGALVVPSTQRSVYSYPCIFHFLDCTESFILFEEWRVHVLSHFRGQAAPTEAQCTLCSWNMADSTRDVAWNFMLRHVAIEHFQIGHTLATSRPDFALYKFLFNRKILNEPQFKALFMTRTTGTYEQRAQLRGVFSNETGHGPFNAPFVRTANEVRQGRRGQGRRAPESRASRPSSRSRRLETT
jgi:hypothetical protein